MFRVRENKQSRERGNTNPKTSHLKKATLIEFSKGMTQNLKDTQINKRKIQTKTNSSTQDTNKSLILFR
jgi:hypothetical protein